ncbi:zinc finger protein 845-like [Xenia sp. Carnegie-2017]|uniref:zinc finger protein 845-like n=1 Tax=Xenia sp. Carnegie-2017 TaxID=2897299 RepID=UPI001F046DC5|nr:zinc finger protein 845-like [Xenia sp. Carnegie-2017]XP_046858982.1 zinc finger protein 845-like [Xenia sp. Carnegie-2017]XP_046858983.1 zinc finger protein 845-like [Xenia sp. Carnegie-2017]XP_046858984.1 zinc finger protein 845-like [Xenia sp. Carnegie-2017]
MSALLFPYSYVHFKKIESNASALRSWFIAARPRLKMITDEEGTSTFSVINQKRPSVIKLAPKVNVSDDREEDEVIDVVGLDGIDEINKTIHCGIRNDPKYYIYDQDFWHSDQANNNEFELGQDEVEMCRSGSINKRNFATDNSPSDCDQKVSTNAEDRSESKCRLHETRDEYQLDMDENSIEKVLFCDQSISTRDTTGYLSVENRLSERHVISDKSETNDIHGTVRYVSSRRGSMKEEGSEDDLRTTQDGSEFQHFETLKTSEHFSCNANQSLSTDNHGCENTPGCSQSPDDDGVNERRNSTCKNKRRHNSTSSVGRQWTKSTETKSESSSEEEWTASSNQGKKRYGCKECGTRFKKPSALIIHMRTHSGEKPFACDICGKKFSISGNLRRHMFTHTGEKPYKCKACGRGFNNPSHLARHSKKIHI